MPKAVGNGKLGVKFSQVPSPTSPVPVSIDLSDLIKGVYILNLQVGGKEMVKKIVKE